MSTQIQKIAVTVQLTIDVPVTWGREHTMGQVAQQAVDDAMCTLGHVLRPGASSLNEETLERERAKVHIVRGTVRAQMVLEADANGNVWTR